MSIIITNEKIEVTEAMMESHNMTRFGQYGVPVDAQDISKGLEWKSAGDLQNEDYDKIESYFLNKRKI